MFRPVNSKVDFPKLELETLKFWKSSDIFNKSLKIRHNSSLKFTLYEGPPTANGKPGIHHVLSRVFKDVIPRYKTMKGYYCPRIAGWDTHGLPVELEIEKKLGFSTKTEIENYGIDKFNALCRESVFTYLKEWDALTERIGYWVDIEHPYVTLNNTYIESVWWALKQLWDKGLIYQGYRVTPHCPRCGTSLSSHEIALGYKDDTEDPSIYIKFKLVFDSLKQNSKLNSILATNKATKSVFFLAWTTTPWTLPGNTALAVSAESEYSLLESENDYLIMAKALLMSVNLEGYEQIGQLTGEELVGLQYEPLYNPHNFSIEREQFDITDKTDTLAKSFHLEKKDADKSLTYPVISGDFVTMEDGTGIVHIAPAFGEVDFEAGKEYGLNFVQHVDLEGKIMGNYKFAGKFVKEADSDVLDDLKFRGLLHFSGKIKHTYPFCWRCDAPVLYYAKKTWYIKTTARIDELIANNEKINWYPEHIKYGRFGDWLQNNVDWAFSRERYWGTPLNVWHCSSCDKYESIGSIAELKSKEGLKGWSDDYDLHRPFVDNLKYKCSACGGEMQRQPEVIDCWFDSGAMPYAQWHYPFENKELFNSGFPADYISEAVDQTRGWFYSLHAISTLIMNSPSYKNVICLGLILDAQGEKMSKTRGNVVDPESVINKYGADALRWYLFTSSPPGNVRRFSSELVGEIQRNFLMTLWNVYSFFIMYANIDDVNPADIKVEPKADLDVWILSQLKKLIIEVDNLLENYDPTTAGRKIEAFVDDLSNWYIRRSRRRFWKSQNDEDKMSAYFSLYKCLVTLSKLLAPLAPFIAEEIYLNLVKSVSPKAPESVHLTDFPTSDEISVMDDNLIDATKAVITVCSLGRAARAKAGIKVRQPLSQVLIKPNSENEAKGIKILSEQILDELNVKDIQIVNNIAEYNTESFTAMEEGGIWVAVNTQITPELEAEGLAREIVRRLQVMRRNEGLEIADHINIYYSGNDFVNDVMNRFSDYIKQETLAISIINKMPSNEIHSEKYKLMSNEITIGIAKIIS
jgi:isoleucyl-tRNA synthetase